MSEMIPTITIDQMREVDRSMVEDMGIELIRRERAAARRCARLPDSDRGRSVRQQPGGDATNIQ